MTRSDRAHRALYSTRSRPHDCRRASMLRRIEVYIKHNTYMDDGGSSRCSAVLFMIQHCCRVWHSATHEKTGSSLYVRVATGDRRDMHVTPRDMHVTRSDTVAANTE